LQIAEKGHTIQGYDDGVFWERNALRDIKSKNTRKNSDREEPSLFVTNTGARK